MRHARALLESRPFLHRVPDQTILGSDPGTGAEHVRATRAADGAYAFVYCPGGRSLTVELGRLSGPAIAGWWFDPRTGAARPIGERAGGTDETFDPPASGPGNDWVLVLDDATRGFGTPGESA